MLAYSTVLSAQLKIITTLWLADLIQASPNDILVAQGRAQVMGTFLRTLKECHLVRQQKPSTAP